MPFKDLLVYVDATKASEARVALAAAIAKRHAAHLTGVHATSLLDAARAAGYAAFEQAYRALEKAAEERAVAAQAMFEAALVREGIAGAWRIARVAAMQEAIVHARYADLAIVGQIAPDNETPGSPLSPADVLLDSGRPALVVPYVGRFADVGQRVLVAWNASREAARAVHDALPLLAGAKQVTVLAINPERGLGAHGDVPAADIALHLARHGLKAEAAHTVAKDIAEGEALLSYAADLGADLIVAGAYGHSRAREMVFGGVTRTLIREMTAPTLLSH